MPAVFSKRRSLGGGAHAFNRSRRPQSPPRHKESALAARGGRDGGADIANSSRNAVELTTQAATDNFDMRDNEGRVSGSDDGSLAGESQASTADVGGLRIEAPLDGEHENPFSQLTTAESTPGGSLASTPPRPRRSPRSSRLSRSDAVDTSSSPAASPRRSDASSRSPSRSPPKPTATVTAAAQEADQALAEEATAATAAAPDAAEGVSEGMVEREEEKEIEKHPSIAKSSSSASSASSPHRRRRCSPSPRSRTTSAHHTVPAAVSTDNGSATAQETAETIDVAANGTANDEEVTHKQQEASGKQCWGISAFGLALFFLWVLAVAVAIFSVVREPQFNSCVASGKEVFHSASAEFGKRLQGAQQVFGEAAERAKDAAKDYSPVLEAGKDKVVEYGSSAMTALKDAVAPVATWTTEAAHSIRDAASSAKSAYWEKVIPSLAKAIGVTPGPTAYQRNPTTASESATETSESAKAPNQGSEIPKKASESEGDVLKDKAGDQAALVLHTVKDTVWRNPVPGLQAMAASLVPPWLFGTTSPMLPPGGVVLRSESGAGVTWPWQWATALYQTRHKDPHAEQLAATDQSSGARSRIGNGKWFGNGSDSGAAVSKITSSTADKYVARAATIVLTSLSGALVIITAAEAAPVLLPLGAGFAAATWLWGTLARFCGASA